MSKLTEAVFSMQCSFIAKNAAAWAGDILTLPENYSREADPKTVGRFTDDIRKRLDRLDNWSGLAASAASGMTAQDNWISVSERLPGEQGNDSEYVAVFLNGHCVSWDTEKRAGGGWGYKTGFFDAELGCFRVHGRPERFVTHWQPLPTPPTSAVVDSTPSPAPELLVMQIVPTQRVDQLIGSGDPTADEIHDMAVEIMNWRLAHAKSETK